MKLSGSSILTVSTAAIAMMVAAGTPPAYSQTLMDLLFRDRPRQQAAPAPVEVPPAPVKRAAPPRVAGPQYYTYKTDPLVPVNFAAITLQVAQDNAQASPRGIDPASVGSTVSDADSEVARAPLEAVAPRPTGAFYDALPSALAADGDAVPPVERGAEIQQPAEPQPLSREQIAALQDFSLLAEKQAAEALVAFYSEEPTLLWVADGKVSDRARAALRVMGEAGSHGLDSRDYAVSVPQSDAADATLVAFEMELSARLLRYVHDARSGRIDPNRISGYHDFKPKEFDGVAVLRELSGGDDVAAFLEAQHPQNAQYKALRVELELLQARAEDEIVIAPRTVVKPGERNAEFPKILTLIEKRADEAFRSEFGEVLTRHLGSEVYAQELVPVIKGAQRLAGVGDDGVIGPRTVQAIAGESKAVAMEKVRVALEQLRWLPSDLGARHVFLNTPAFDAVYVEDGKEKLSMRTVVGRLDTQTYFFQDEISYVEFHPYWGMPRSILVNTYLPRVLKDPTYFDRNGYEVVGRNGQVVSSTSVDWTAYGANIPFDVRQRPGANNALGEMKIMFPNRHAIYMHDTPDKHLFSRESRALSNGCIRLADPRAMAAAVLGWERDKVNKRLEGKHGRENLSVKVPVYVAYFTAWPTETGEVKYYNDVYNRDEKVRAALEKVEALRAPNA